MKIECGNEGGGKRKGGKEDHEVAVEGSKDLKRTRYMKL